MMNDATKSIKGFLYDRSTSPLMGSFICSWVIWNYRFVFTFFSELSFAAKLHFIDTTIFPDLNSILGQGFLCPLATSLIYIYVYPYPALKTFEFARKAQKKISDKKREIEEARLLTKEESWAIRRMASLREEEFETTLSKKDSEISRLKEDMKLLVAEFKKTTDDKSKEGKTPAESNEKIFSDNIERGMDKLESTTEDVLKCLINEQDPSDMLTIDEVTGKSQIKQLTIQYEFDRLLDFNYIEKKFDPSLRDWKFGLTSKGRRYVMEKKLIEESTAPL